MSWLTAVARCVPCLASVVAVAAVAGCVSPEVARAVHDVLEAVTVKPPEVVPVSELELRR